MTTGTPVREEVDMSDPFVGTWSLNPRRSEFDATHKPREATMGWELQDDPRIAKSRLSRRIAPGAIEQPGMIERDFRPWLVRQAA